MKKQSFILFLTFCLTGMVLAGNMIESAGSVFINSAGEKTEVTLSGRLVGFYFARQVEACKIFTPKLVEFYSGLKQAGYNFEIIFIGAGESAAEMTQCMREFNMPWPAVPYDSEGTTALKRIKRDELNNKLVPTLIVTRDRQVITTKGRADVQELGLEAYQKWLTMVPETVSLPPAENKAALSSRPTQPVSVAAVGPLPAPYKKEMDMNELRKAILDLDGEIVETSITYVQEFERVGEGLYRVFCGHGVNGSVSSWPVLIPEEGRKVFKALSEKGIHAGGTHQTVYLRVHSKSPIKAGKYSYQLKAVGIHYSSTKNEYSW